MWAVILLGLLVGATASEQPSLWKPGFEYVYNVSATSLTGLNQLGNQWSGLIYNVTLVARPRKPGEVQLRIYDAIYSRIHANLSGGFDNPIPEEYLHWKPLRLSKAPFDVIYKNGEIVDMLVDCSLSEAEVNQLKGIASMFQIDVDEEKGSIFKKFEETVTGDCMTQYARTQIPKYLLQSEGKIALPDIIDGRARVIDVSKELNSSWCRDDRVYYFGLDEKPFNSSSAPALAHSSNSRALVANMSGSYLLGWAEVAEKIVASPFFYNQEKGMIASRMTAVLAEHYRLRKSAQAPSPDCPTGGLIYNHIDAAQGRNPLDESGSGEDREQPSDEASESASASASDEVPSRRYRRAVSPSKQHLPEPKLKSPPHHPYEALFVGVGGQSVRYDRHVNATRLVFSLVRDIAEAINEPSLIAPKEALSKVAMLISLLRVYDSITLQRIAEKLYNAQSPENPISEYAWEVYVMAVAQTGTGPALLNLIYMVNEDMLSEGAAADAVAYIPRAARAPTPEYVEELFKFAVRDASEKYPLNVTAVLAATELIHLAQVSNDSSSRYPENIYEDLLGEYRPRYAKELGEKLRRAVAKGYSPNIQLYIRALGNIGHPDIVKIFKPYLEGRIPVSTYQRFMMVMCLDKLAEAYPEVAQNVFLQLFQNTAETHEIRCASALLLMATNPPASVLQKLAHFSNQDQNSQVKAVVKSIIQSAVKLQRPEDSELAEAAQSALHMLTTEEYGLDKSFADYSSAVVEDYELAYELLAGLIGSMDSYIHSAASLKLKKFHGPLISHQSEVTSMVSSVRQLVRVLQNQTSEYQPSPSGSDPAVKLNIQRNVSEPLEGNILLDLFASKSFVAFDNTTIELLREVLEDELQDLQDGNSYNKTILANTASASIGLPTILGLPANIKFDAPVLISIRVNATVDSQPDIEEVLGESQKHLQYINVTSEIQATYASQMNSKIHIILPIEKKVFESSLVQNLQLYVPVKLNISQDLEQNITTIKAQPLEKNRKYPLVRASRAPTTAIWEPIPLINAAENRRIVHVRPLKQAQYVLGKHSTGMAFIADYKSEAEFVDWKAAADHGRKFDAISSLLFPWASNEIYYYNHTLYYAPEQSSAKDVTIQIRVAVKEYTKYVPGPQSKSAEQSLESEDEEEQPQNYRHKQRRHPRFPHKRAAPSSELDFFQDLVNQLKDRELANTNLFIRPLEQNLDPFEKSVLERGTTYIFETKVIFEQPRGGEFRLSLMHSRNTLRSVTLSDAEVWAKPAGGRVFQASAEAVGFFPPLPEMNYEEAYKANPNSTLSFSYISEYEGGRKSQIFADLKAGQSERLKKQVGTSDIAKKCRQQMQEGNYILYACRNATEQAGLLDNFSVKGTFSDLSPEFINATYKAYSAVRYLLYPFISQRADLSAAHQVRSGRFNASLWFSPKWHSFNATLNVPALSANFTNVRGWPEGKVHLWLPHPSRHVAEKLSRGYQHRYVPSACSLDKRNMTTFDNLTIPLELPECWTLILSLVPKPVYNDDLGYTNVSVLAMQEQDTRKFKIQVGKHVIEQVSTKYIIVDRMKYNLRSDETTHVDADGAVLAVAALLPGGSSWLTVPEYGLTLHYDGERALLLANETYKDASRGLCGTYDGETVTDLTIPKNCILKDPRHFVAQYVIPDTCQVDSVKRLQSEARAAECYPFEIIPADNIVASEVYSPDRASARVADDEESLSSEDSASPESDEGSSPQSLRRVLKPIKIVKAVEHGKELAFSIEKVLQCPRGLVPDKVKWVKIPYHVIQNTKAGRHWFENVKKAPQNFDFSQKAKNVELRTEVHLSCRRP